MTDEWLSVPATGRLLGITDHLVHKLMNTGMLTGYRIGRSYRVRIEDVHAYLELVKVKPGDLDHLMPHAYDAPRHLEAVDTA